MVTSRSSRVHMGRTSASALIGLIAPFGLRLMVGSIAIGIANPRYPGADGQGRADLLGAVRALHARLLLPVMRSNGAVAVPDQLANARSYSGEPAASMYAASTPSSASAPRSTPSTRSAASLRGAGVDVALDVPSPLACCVCGPVSVSARVGPLLKSVPASVENPAAPHSFLSSPGPTSGLELGDLTIARLFSRSGSSAKRSARQSCALERSDAP